MNTRRPTDAAGERWRKWGAKPPIDLRNVDTEARWVDGYDDGYDRGMADSLPPRFVVILVAVVFGISGLLIGWAAGIAS